MKGEEAWSPPSGVPHMVSVELVSNNQLVLQEELFFEQL